MDGTKRCLVVVALLQLDINCRPESSTAAPLNAIVDGAVLRPMLCLIAPKQRSKFTRLILRSAAKKLKYASCDTSTFQLITIKRVEFMSCH